MNERKRVSSVDRVLLTVMFGGVAVSLVYPLAVIVSMAVLAVLLVRLVVQRSDSGRGSKLMEGARRVPARSWLALVVASVVSGVARSTSVDPAVLIVGSAFFATGLFWVLGRITQRREQRELVEADGATPAEA